MKLIFASLLLFASAATLGTAQTIPQGTFQHIIIVIQENRTPDNLFGAGAPLGTKCGVGDAFEAGVDIDNGGYGKINGLRQEICNTPMHMNGTQDPDHSYQDQGNHNYGWLDQYDSGNMDGFCEIYQNNQCLQYSYVQKTDAQPHFDIATANGFANYMFQTNEGPSFPAHQFLFTGTSAPTAPNDPNDYYLDFVAENGGGNGNSSGCANGETAPLVVPTGVEQPQPGPLECYPHDSLVTNSTIGDKGITWRYYTPTSGAIWTVPASIPEVCYGTNSDYTAGMPCNSTEWNSHLSFPSTITPYGSAPILTDIQNCYLQQISWVIPDEAWSDHAGANNPPPPAAPYGPSWAGDIVNAVGTDKTCEQGAGYWSDTAIFIVWDDWGGWFDHVSPELTPTALREDPGAGFTNCNPNPPDAMWGCGYTYGFRVPLLVVSQYTKAGYVSGGCVTGCPNNVFPFVHDFGSILAFTEWNFGMQPIAPAPGYADSNAPDGANHNIPLLDFFLLSNQRSFTPISTTYPASFFESYYFNNPNYQPTGPDGGSDD